MLLVSEVSCMTILQFLLFCVSLCSLLLCLIILSGLCYQIWCTKGFIYIHDVHTEEEGIRLRWTQANREGSASCGRPHIKLDPFHLMFSHAKKWAFCIRIPSLNGIKSGHFSSI